MDFGGNVIALVPSSTDTSNITPSTSYLFGSDLEAKHKWHRSVQQQGDDFSAKLPNNSDDFPLSKTMLMKNNNSTSNTPLLRSNGSSLFSDGQQNMLSFSSPNSHNVALPYYHQTSTPYSRNTGIYLFIFVCVCVCVF